MEQGPKIKGHGAPKSAGKLTSRMAQALEDLGNGGAIESGTGFSWPSWHTRPTSSLDHGCPPCAVLEGLHARGLLTVQNVPAEFGKWLVSINGQGREALARFREKERSAGSRKFKRFQLSFVRASLGGVRATQRTRETVLARTESEARKKLQRTRAGGGVLDDVQVDGVFG